MSNLTLRLLGAAAVTQFALAVPALAEAGAQERVQPVPPPSPFQTEAERKAASPDDKSPKVVVNAFNQMAFFDGDPIGAIEKYVSDDFVERYPDFANDE